MDREAFIKIYAEKLMTGNAAVFIGAGLSVGSGFVNWRELLRDMASHVNLDINKEHDLVSVAQYYSNEVDKKTTIEKVRESLQNIAPPNKNHELLARLPVSAYWTTNYDTLIEKALEGAGKVPDIKFRKEHLWRQKTFESVPVYKMHGDIHIPEDIIFIKNDYEEYYNKHKQFVRLLIGHLIEKTFLFVGVGFSDPNLDHVLGQVRVAAEDDVRRHYLLTKRVSSDDYDSDSGELKYAQIKQELFIGDLGKRYGIRTILIDDYSEITDILEAITTYIKEKNQAELLQKMFKSENYYERVEAAEKIGRLSDPRFNSNMCYLPSALKGPTWKQCLYECPQFGLVSIPKNDGKFYISIYPTTIQQYRYYATKSSLEIKTALWYRKNNNTHPVTCITLGEAKNYCAWLTDFAECSSAFESLREDIRQGWVFRLPTREEWEKAESCIVGEAYPWGMTPDGMDTAIDEWANLLTSRLGGTSPVGCFPKGASLHGVQDMHGNIWEWTGTEKKGKPGYNYVKGGSFIESKKDLEEKEPYTYRFEVDRRSPCIGFRIVFAPPRSAQEENK